MRELCFAERPEYLKGFSKLSILALYDLGVQDQNPARYTGDYGEGERITYREYWGLGIPPLQFDTGQPLTRAPGLPATPVHGTKIGVDFYSDYFGKLPDYMHPNGYFIDIVPADARITSAVEATRVVENQREAHELGRLAVDAILREQPFESCAIVGEGQILDFLRGYINESEADKNKSMPWRSSNDYLLSRADGDLVSLITSAYVGGAETTNLPIPEEHRYRALLNAASVFAWFYTGSRREFDIPNLPSSAFESERQRKLEIEMSHPLHLVNAILHRDHYELLELPYNPSLAYFLGAYGITEAEFTETVQQNWYMQTYWSEVATDRVDNHDHFNRPPDPGHSKLFVAQMSPEDLQRYNGLTAATVHAGINPYGSPLDIPR